MPQKLTVASLAMAILSLSGEAMAQPPNGTPRPPSRQFTFTDELVQGQLLSPVGANSRPLPRHHGPSLIRIREHFVQELTRSVEQL